MNLKRYHLRQARVCEGIIAHLGRRSGLRLDPGLARRAEAYAADVFGWRGYAPWLKVYTLLQGEFREGWIPDDYYAQVVSAHINGAYRGVAQLRQASVRLFGQAGMPDSLHVVRGLLFAPDGAPVRPDQAATLVFARGPRTIFKTTGSWAGEGIRILDAAGFAAAAARGPWPDGVFQDFIEAHPMLAGLYPAATATLRLTTAIDDAGEVGLRAAYLRLGSKGDAYVRAATVVRIALDCDTGDFEPYALCADWTRVTAHPDTGAGFAGLRMPGFAAARELVLGFHRRYPLVGCVGWDIAVDAAEAPWLLEWNAMHNDIKLSEATMGPCFLGLGWEKLWRRGAGG